MVSAIGREAGSTLVEFYLSCKWGPWLLAVFQFPSLFGSRPLAGHLCAGRAEVRVSPTLCKLQRVQKASFWAG